MLEEKDLGHIENLIHSGMDRIRLRDEVEKIRAKLNPHPAGQKELNVPRLDTGEEVLGVQHKYRETMLFFPAEGQVWNNVWKYVEYLSPLSSLMDRTTISLLLFFFQANFFRMYWSCYSCFPILKWPPILKDLGWKIIVKLWVVIVNVHVHCKSTLLYALIKSQAFKINSN